MWRSYTTVARITLILVHFHLFWSCKGWNTYLTTGFGGRAPRRKFWVFYLTKWEFFTPPQNRKRALFFRFFSKSAKLCNSNVSYCILRWIRCIWRHFQQNFDVVDTFRLPAASFFAAAPQKWLILAILRHFPLLLVVRLVSKKVGFLQVCQSLSIHPKMLS